jgi:hypothetical protein|tara:strand:- start:299 stop:634 length:336 start_codon:yes stop_codon:yes gene_type:complete
MAKYATGKFAQRISDRSGMAFPYNEMVREWNGSTVHISEFEAKHPQLDPRYHPTDPQSLQNAKPQTVPATVFLGINMIAGNIFNSVGMQPTDDNKQVKMNAYVGTAQVVIS